jgi:NADPH-dependent glutamate synthase beta subunit-like oxidoreductase
MDIPLMNRMIAKGDFNKALEVVHRKIALPATLGYICPAPCEKACRRKNMDGPVSICLLKRSASLESKHLPELNNKTTFSGKKVAIAGAGPAALSAAFYLLKAGYGCTLFFREKLPGGTLLSLVSSEKLPAEALEHDINIISNMGAHFRSEYNITSETFENELVKNFDAVVVATGNKSETPLETFGISDSFTANLGNLQKTNTSRKGVFVCGNILKETRMAVKAVAQGKSAATEAIRYLEGLSQCEPPFFNSAFGQLMQEEFAEYQVESNTSTPVVPQAGFLGGFSREEAISEASRCMHCDCRKPQSCQLRKYAAEYGANRRKHSDGKRARIKKYFQHQTIVYEPEKCIRCGLCVEISSRDETLGLTYIGRGFDVRIGVPYNENISHALQVTAVNCAAMCPTGALSLKNQEERI